MPPLAPVGPSICVSPTGDCRCPPTMRPGLPRSAIHAGAAPDPSTGARVTPIYQTTSYVFNDVDHAASLFNLEAFGNIYTRIGGPTQAVLEQRVAALEGGTAALAVASGHAAQMIVFHTLMEPGDEFVAGRQLYGGSVNQFNHSFKKFNWNVAWADATDPESFAEGHHAQDQGDLLQVDRQSRRHRRRPAGHLGHRQEGRRAADRRQHAGDALPVPAQGATAPTSSCTRSPSSWAGTAIRSAASSSTAAPSTGWRPRRNTPRWQDPNPSYNGMQLAETFGNFAFAIACRVMGLRDLGPGDFALQRLPDPHGHRDAAAAHGQALRERAWPSPSISTSTSRSNG